MKSYLVPIALIILLTYINTVDAGMSYRFKNPSFTGIGYSSHVLSIEQLQFNREEDKAGAIASEQKRLERALASTTLNKFIKNLESRIYSTLSKQMVDSMFAECVEDCAGSGSAEIEGSLIAWKKDPITGEITLNISNDDSTTTITIPGAGEFTF